MVKLADEKRINLGVDHENKQSKARSIAADAVHRETAERIKKCTDEKHNEDCKKLREEHTRACDKSDASIKGLKQDLQELQDDMEELAEKELDERASNVLLVATVCEKNVEIDQLRSQAVLAASAAEKTITAQHAELVLLKSTASSAVTLSPQPQSLKPKHTHYQPPESCTSKQVASLAAIDESRAAVVAGYTAELASAAAENVKIYQDMMTMTTKQAAKAGMVAPVMKQIEEGTSGFMAAVRGVGDITSRDHGRTFSKGQTVQETFSKRGEK